MIINLSPYEHDRIIKDDFGKTEMGRDLLAQDYMLKQITSSLIYPEDSLGKKFWSRIYDRAWQEYHTSNVPVNTFNKVWIIPDQAVVYESGNTAYILKSHLKVMLEEDYLSLNKHMSSPNASVGDLKKTHTIASKVIREIILPELEKEVNQGNNFANLRQMYSGMILAAWYKKALKESLLGKIYADKAKVKGIDQDPKTNEAIYRRYLKAFKKGVFNYIKEDVDKYTNEAIPRKYFSGGLQGISSTVTASPYTSIADLSRLGAEVLTSDDTLKYLPSDMLPSVSSVEAGSDRMDVTTIECTQVSEGAKGLPANIGDGAMLIDGRLRNLESLASVILSTSPMPDGLSHVLYAPSIPVGSETDNVITAAREFSVTDFGHSHIGILVPRPGIPNDEFLRNYHTHEALVLYRNIYHGMTVGGHIGSRISIPAGTRLRLIARNDAFQSWYIPELMVNRYEYLLLFQQAEQLADQEEHLWIFNEMAGGRSWAGMAAFRRMAFVLSRVRGYVPETEYERVRHRLDLASRGYSDVDMDDTRDGYHWYSGRVFAGLRARMGNDRGLAEARTVEEILGAKDYADRQLELYARELRSGRRIELMQASPTITAGDIDVIFKSRENGDNNTVTIGPDLEPGRDKINVDPYEVFFNRHNVMDQTERREDRLKEWLVTQMAIAYALHEGLDHEMANRIGITVANRWETYGRDVAMRSGPDLTDDSPLEALGLLPKTQGLLMRRLRRYFSRENITIGDVRHLTKDGLLLMSDIGPSTIREIERRLPSHLPLAEAVSPIQIQSEFFDIHKIVRGTRTWGIENFMGQEGITRLDDFSHFSEVQLDVYMSSDAVIRIREALFARGKYLLGDDPTHITDESSIWSLGLERGVWGALNRAGIKIVVGQPQGGVKTVGQLREMDYHSLVNLRNFGANGLAEVRDRLFRAGEPFDWEHTTGSTEVRASKKIAGYFVVVQKQFDPKVTGADSTTIVVQLRRDWKTMASLPRNELPRRTLELIEEQQPRDVETLQDAIHNIERDTALLNKRGGIDFNTANFNLQTIKRDGRGVPLPVYKQDMAQLARIQGFDAEIVEIRPAFNLPIISELKQKLESLS